MTVVTGIEGERLCEFGEKSLLRAEGALGGGKNRKAANLSPNWADENVGTD
jgi:hypothetical protein